MEGQKESPVFHSDNIKDSKNANHKYFVNIIKNPIVRFLLRKKIIKEKAPAPEPPAPTPQPVVAPPAPAKTPQFRATFRISNYSSKKEDLSVDAKRYILCAILVVLILCVGAIFFISTNITKKSEEKNEQIAETIETTTEEEILALRKDLSNIAHEITSKKETTIGDFIGALNEKIDSVDNSAAKRSLNIYAIYVLIRHGQNNSANEEYERFFFDDTISTSERCELYEYRKLLAKSSDDTEYNEEENESGRTKFCSEALLEEENIKKDLETDFAYAERLYYKGFLTEAITRFENLDSAVLSDVERLSSFNILADYYYTSKDYDKYSVVYDILTKIRMSMQNDGAE